nr:hypothetical protein [Kibdelosporangium sp. MJ126-NF4]CTQ89468.1 hypothetical protein [Kibdelosporangium sp. MJ126-NF4]
MRSILDIRAWQPLTLLPGHELIQTRRLRRESAHLFGQPLLVRAGPVAVAAE